MVDGKSNIPIYEEIVVNGDKVYFSFNQKGPLIKKSNLPAWVDSVEIEAREAMQLGITPFGDIPPNFLPNYIEKFKEQLKLNPENTKGLKFEDVYFNYPVPLGVRVTDNFDNKWIVINPKKIGDYYGGNVVDEIIHTIEHELVHVNQPSVKTKINRYGYTIKTGEEALKRLQGEKSSSGISKQFEMIGTMDSFKSRLKDVGLEKEFNEFLEKFRKETGKDPYRSDTGKFTNDFMRYFSESDFNKKYATKIEYELPP